MDNIFRRFGVDESGSLYDRQPMSVVVMAFDNDSHARHAEKRRGHFYRTAPPCGTYRYVVLTSNLLEAAKTIYPEPRGSVETSWNGKYYEFKLRRDAIVRLMEEFDFDPNRDMVFVDSFCRPVHLRREIVGAYERLVGVPVDIHSVKCMTNGDNRSVQITSADDIAYKLHERYINGGHLFEEFRSEFTPDDLVRLNMTRHEQRNFGRLSYSQVLSPA